MAQVYPNNASSDSGRRRYVRQPLIELAYLDIGADNGGIVLNLSEEGMGFQAAIPLSSQTKVNLRIQLPHSRARVEFEAEIMWLSPGKQQAGVRFLDMPTEARVQIHKWIRAQLSPPGPPEGSTTMREGVSDSLRKQEPVREIRKNKWTSLMSELEEQQSLLEKRLSIESSAETGHSGPIAQEKRPSLIEHLEGLNYSGQQEIPIHGALSEETAIEQAPEHPGMTLPIYVSDEQQNGEEVSDTDSTPPNYGNRNPSELIHWPIRAPQNAPATIPENAPVRSISPTQSADTLATANEASANVSAFRASAMPTPLAATRSNHAQGWIAPAILLTSVCVLFFGIGTWLGRPDRHPQVAQPPTEPAVAVPVTGSASNLGIKEAGAKRPIVDAPKVRTGDPKTNFATKNRQEMAALSPGPPIVISTPQPAPAKTSSTVLMTEKPPAIKPAPTPAPIAQPSDPTPPAPKIVAGRQLRPTDRFNPCHLSYRVEPEYPVEAKEKRLEGAVKIHQYIGADGSVQGVKVISGPSILVPAAMEAAKYWRYLPALLNGEPVATEQDIEIDFRLPR